jgi:hypothetical protein
VKELTKDDLTHRWRDRTMQESVDEAIAAAGDAEEYETPEIALRWMLSLAWSRLQEARRTAINGRWSIACEWHIAEIVGLTKLVGPINWGHVPVDLILDGTYEHIHEAIGHPTPLSDDDRRRAREVMERRHDR